METISIKIDSSFLSAFSVCVSESCVFKQGRVAGDEKVEKVSRL